MDVNNWNVLDLFAGIGGLGAGFKKAGYKVIASVELEETARSILLANDPALKIFGDIQSNETITGIKEIAKDISFIIGGFPCQGFSMSGDRNPLDPRNKLYLDFLKIIEIVKPVAIVMENVKGLVSFKDIRDDLTEEERVTTGLYLTKIQRIRELERFKAQRILNESESKEYKQIKPKVKKYKKYIRHFLEPILPRILERLTRIGYIPTWKILNSADYGTAQSRERIIIVCIRKDLNTIFKFPKPTHAHHRRTVNDAIGDLEFYDDILVDERNAILERNHLTDHDFTNHSQSQVEKMKMLVQGDSLYKNYKESWRRLKGNEPAFTIKGNHGATAVHPNKPRLLTCLEIRRLQDIEDSFIMLGTRAEKYRYLGNMVPINLSKAIACQLKKILTKGLINSRNLDFYINPQQSR